METAGLKFSDTVNSSITQKRPGALNSDLTHMYSASIRLTIYKKKKSKRKLFI